MRLFRRAHDTKTSVIRREGVSAVAEAPSPVAMASMTIVRPSAPVSRPDDSVDQPEDSDVFLSKSGEREHQRGGALVAREVTLFVHGWHNVEPGLLSWTFPSLRAALDAVQRMKNAIGWCVVSGTGWRDLDAARADGAVLVEQLA